MFGDMARVRIPPPPQHLSNNIANTIYSGSPDTNRTCPGTSGFNGIYKGFVLVASAQFGPGLVLDAEIMTIFGTVYAIFEDCSSHE